MQRKEFDRKLINYICESGSLTQTQIAGFLNTSNSALHNKMTRGTLPLIKLWKFMTEKQIPIPSWAEIHCPSDNLTRAGHDSCEAENQFLKERLLKAEVEKDRLLSLLEDMVTQRERLLEMLESKGINFIKNNG